MDTKAIITNAAFELFRRSTIGDVTVQEILDLAHVSRSTFYRHFTDKYDVITQYCEASTEKIVRSMSNSRWKEIYRAQNRFVYENLEFFKVLYRKDATGSLERYMNRNDYEQILGAYLAGSGKDAPEREISLALDFTLSGLRQVIRSWVLHNAPVDVDTFSESSFSLIPACLRKYL